MGFLRILLAIAVIVTHMRLPRPYMISGADAVKIFFMISGFYMAMILSEKYGNSRHGLKMFASNRFLRLYPTYLVVLILTTIWYFICVVSTHGRTPELALVTVSKSIPAWQAVLLWLPNLTLAGIDLPSLFHWSQQTGFLFLKNLPFEDQGGIKWVGYTVPVRQSWSIGAEIWFYSLAPLIVFGSLRKIILIGTASALLGYFAKWPTYFFWPDLLVFFVAGILIYKFYKAAKVAQRLPKSAWARNLIVLSPIFWVILLPTFGFPTPDLALFIIAAISIPFLFATTMKSRVDRFIGNLSYATYLDHLLVAGIVALGMKKFAFIPAAAETFIVIAGSLAMAFLLERFLERPLDKIRERNAKS